MSVLTVFMQCFQAVRRKELVRRANSRDKEFHFQNWFKKRLQTAGLSFEPGGRNSDPDFRIVKYADGYELKGLAYPGRDASFDSNSQAPTGFHNDRNIYYGFQVSLHGRKVILFGQVLTTVDRDEDFSRVSPYVTSELAACEIEHSPLFRAG